MMALLCLFEGGRDTELCPASVYFGMSYVILGSRCQAGLKKYTVYINKETQRGQTICLLLRCPFMCDFTFFPYWWKLSQKLRCSSPKTWPANWVGVHGCGSTTWLIHPSFNSESERSHSFQMV